jgi:hypothetical protein
MSRYLALLGLACVRANASEFAGTPKPPPQQISEGYANYVRETAAKIEREHRDKPAMLEHAAKLRRDIEGLAPPIPTDSRTPQQIGHDRRFGVTYAPDGNVKLPDVLAGVIQRDAAGNAPDAATRDASLKAVGIDPGKALVDAQAVLDRVGSLVKAEKLTAHTLAALSAYGAHLQKHAASRPKS